LSKNSLKTANATQGNTTTMTAGNGGNRVSKHNLRDNQNNLKDYGMNIITGGKPASQTSMTPNIHK
jgi:hypothetical protein